MSDPNSVLNVPATGGGSSLPKKTKLVVDLTEEYRKLNIELQKTADLSETISKNLSKASKASKGASGGTSGYGAADTMGFVDPPNTGRNSSASSSMSFGGLVKGFGTNILSGLPGLAASGAAAAMQMVTPSNFIENDISRQRFGFYAGTPGSGAGAFQSMMNQGTSTSAMDAAQAAMMGASMGVMPGLKNYGTVAGSAATFSNLAPGAGLAGGMGAVAGLNQASSVNRLRMIGINVRNSATGLMRSVNDIAKDLWTYLNNSKTGGSKITANDLSLSLQSGNSLASIMDQYFSNDPVERQGIISALYQFAGASGNTDLSKSALGKTGALPGVATSIANRNAASYSAINAYTSAGVQGVEQSNKMIADAAHFFGDHVKQFGGFVTTLTKLDTLAGAGNNAGATLMSGATAFIGGTVGALLTGISKNLFKGFAGLFSKATANAEAALGKGISSLVGGSVSAASKGISALLPKLFTGALKFLGPVIGGLVSGVSGFNDAKSKKTDFWGGLASSAGTGALAGGLIGLIGGPQGALVGAGIGAAVDAGGYALGYMFGQGGDGATVDRPLSGNPPITSQFQEVRHLNINGQQVTTQPHRGVDFGVPTGTPVHAAKDGQVIDSNYNPSGFGNYLTVQHNDGYQTIYGHLSDRIAAKGSTVSAGDVIGLSGNTGFSTGPHLHFQVQDSAGNLANPLDYLAGAATPTGAISGAYSSSSSGASTAAGKLPSGTIMYNEAAATANTASVDGKGGGGAYSASGTNYGGVTVHINLPTGSMMNEQALAQEIKRVLADESNMRNAVSR